LLDWLKTTNMIGMGRWVGITEASISQPPGKVRRTTSSLCTGICSRLHESPFSSPNT